MFRGLLAGTTRKRRSMHAVVQSWIDHLHRTLHVRLGAMSYPSGTVHISNGDEAVAASEGLPKRQLIGQGQVDIILLEIMP